MLSADYWVATQQLYAQCPDLSHSAIGMTLNYLRHKGELDQRSANPDDGYSRGMYWRLHHPRARDPVPDTPPPPRPAGIVSVAVGVPDFLRDSPAFLRDTSGR